MASIGDGIDAVRNGSIEGGVNLKNGQAGANIVV